MLDLKKALDFFRLELINKKTDNYNYAWHAQYK